MRMARIRPITTTKQWLKRFPVLITLKRRIQAIATQDANHGMSTLSLIESLPLYAPFSEGTYKGRAALTIRTANSIFPFLVSLLDSLGRERPSIIKAEEFPQNQAEIESATAVETALDSFGSDKAWRHHYHHVYGRILASRSEIEAVLEIGMGTTNRDIVSHMGPNATPGASLRAFRAFLPNAMIFGADIDKRILFQEERIATYHVDQTNLDSLEILAREVPDDLDLVVDDGLHSPDANVAVLAFGLRKLKVGGWIVIEDISKHALPVWEVVAALLPGSCNSFLIEASGAYVFAVQKSG